LLVEHVGHVEAAVMRANVKTITRSPTTVSVLMERKLLGGQRSSPSLQGCAAPPGLHHKPSRINSLA
jgi:hypothetical protein